MEGKEDASSYLAFTCPHVPKIQINQNSHAVTANRNQGANSTTTRVLIVAEDSMGVKLTMSTDHKRQLQVQVESGDRLMCSKGVRNIYKQHKHIHARGLISLHKRMRTY